MFGLDADTRVFTYIIISNQNMKYKSTYFEFQLFLKRGFMSSLMIIKTAYYMPLSVKDCSFLNQIIQYFEAILTCVSIIGFLILLTVQF